MLKLLADEDFNHNIVRGLELQDSPVDILTVQDALLSGVRDEDVLAYAAEADRLLVSHDTRTMPTYSVERIRAGEPMPGLILVPQRLPIGRAIEDLFLLVTCSVHDEYQGQIVRLPL